MRRAALLALLATLAAGCGSQAKGKATVWVTRDRGSVVLVSASVPAGLTAAQGLERVAKVGTRYGGRYVRSVNGVSEQGRSSWFYYVNGYLADRSSAEYRLRAGDVEWWDFRSWTDPAQFLHGYDGQRRPAVVVSTDRSLGRRLARLVRGRLVSSAPAGANVLDVVPGARPRFAAHARLEAGAPVRFELDSAFARRLLADPTVASHRYEVP